MRGMSLAEAEGLGSGAGGGVGGGEVGAAVEGTVAHVVHNLAVAFVGRIVFKGIADGVVVELVETEDDCRRAVLAFCEILDLGEAVFLGEAFV